MAAVCPLFYCRKMAAIESARPVWCAACPRDSSGGLGDAHQQAKSFVCTKGHCLPLLSRIRVNTVTDVVGKQPSGCTVIQI